MIARRPKAQLEGLLAEYPAVEIKRSLDPRPGRGFHRACVDVEPEARFVVYPGAERYRIAEGIEAITVADLANEITGEMAWSSDLA